MDPGPSAEILFDVHGFDWDDGNREKCVGHGVSRPEAEEVFGDSELRIAPDPRHSGTETRSFAIGRTKAGRYAFVVFTLRSRDDRVMIRPVSVRYMHDREVRRYAQTTA